MKHVVDNGANDADNAVGVIKVANLPTGSYSVVETEGADRLLAARGDQPERGRHDAGWLAHLLRPAAVGSAHRDQDRAG